MGMIPKILVNQNVSYMLGEVKCNISIPLIKCNSHKSILLKYICVTNQNLGKLINYLRDKYMEQQKRLSASITTANAHKVANTQFMGMVI